MPLEFTATDDVAVALAEVEYRVNRGDPAREPIAATGYKTRRPRPRTRSAWRGKVKPGDVVEYRIRVDDNLPPEFGGPHVVYYPADHALVLHVASDKEILALRDDINAAPRQDQGRPQGGGARRLQDAQRLARPPGPDEGPGRGGQGPEKGEHGHRNST